MRALYAHGISSVLVRGRPDARGAIDRRRAGRSHLLGDRAGVSAESRSPCRCLAGVDMAAVGAKVRFDRVEQVGEDVMISGTFDV